MYFKITRDMIGFFPLLATNTNPRKTTCNVCGLSRNSTSSKLSPYGAFKKKILVIGEYPSALDYERQALWQGKGGRKLKTTLAEFGVDLYEDCLSIHAVFCPPAKSPTPKQVECCRKNVFEILKKYSPHVILLFGTSALESVIGNRWKKDLGTISKWYGHFIPDQELQAWICPLFSPNWVLEEKGVNQLLWRKNLQRAIALTKKKVPKTEDFSITYLENLESLYDITSPLISIDYETTGLKPYACGHRIVCAAVAIDDINVMTFMLPTTKKAREPLIELLKNPKIGKMAHNLKFEEVWSRQKLRQETVNWVWDSMIAAHVLDNRPGITGLKFQTYINFGVIDYDSEISSYLHSSNEEASNGLNKVGQLIESEEGRNQLMKYCAMDAGYQYRLAKLQMQKLNYTIDDYS